jgi:hypothetical protein
MFEKLLERWAEKTKKNTYVNDMEYTKKDKTYTEKVYLKRSTMPLGDWKRVYAPFYFDDEGNVIMNRKGTRPKVNYINLIFGGWRNLVLLIVLLTIAGMVLIQFSTNYNYIDTLHSIPCVQDYLNQSRINISNLNLTIN